jgi:hypothetical protein
MGISANVVRLGWLMLLGCLLAGCKAICRGGFCGRYQKMAGNLETGCLYL